MNTIALSDLETFAVGLFALVLATAIARRVPLLARLNVPIAVVGGLLVAFIVRECFPRLALVSVVPSP